MKLSRSFIRKNNMKIFSNKISEEIFIPSSKSYANRALVLGALLDKEIKISNLPLSSDVNSLVDALEILELLEKKEQSVLIKYSFPEHEKPTDQIITLNLGEGGTTIRFLLTFLALGKNKYKIKVHPRFKKRPIKQQLDLLQSLGAKIELLEEDDELCTIQGPIKLRDLTIDSSKTTQTASSFELLKVKYDFNIILLNLVSSGKYLSLTKKLVEQFKMETHFLVPVDMSCASYFIALGTFFQSICIKNIISVDPFQADSQVFQVLDDIGAKYTLDENGLKLLPQLNYKPFELDASSCLDLVPTLAFMASYIEGTTHIKGLKNLLYKESNRIDGVTSILDAFKVKYVLVDFELSITGSRASKKQVPQIKVLPDHRLVMMASLFIKMQGEGEVFPSEVVAKSFNNFFELINGSDTVFNC